MASNTITHQNTFAPSEVSLSIAYFATKTFIKSHMCMMNKLDYKKLYQDIMNLDPKIRLVTICDIDGRIMYSEHREGVRNLLTPEESKKSLELAVNAWKTRSELAPKIGEGKYVLAEYERIKRITMPLGDEEKHLLYITTEPEADHSNIIRGIGGVVIRKILKF
jgi:hypothetical protein